MGTMCAAMRGPIEPGPDSTGTLLYERYLQLADARHETPRWRLVRRARLRREAKSAWERYRRHIEGR
jgi:hypothetical protein